MCEWDAEVEEREKERGKKINCCKLARFARNSRLKCVREGSKHPRGKQTHCHSYVNNHECWC